VGGGRGGLGCKVLYTISMKYIPGNCCPSPPRWDGSNGESNTPAGLCAASIRSSKLFASGRLHIKTTWVQDILFCIYNWNKGRRQLDLNRNGSIYGATVGTQ
jgi:hypothetical protein